MCDTKIPNLHLKPVGLVIKPGKNDRLIFDASFHVDHEAKAVNGFTSKENEPALKYGDAWERHLKRMCSMRISHPNKEILLCDDDTSGAFRHLKNHPFLCRFFGLFL